MVATCNTPKQRTLLHLLSKHKENELFIARIACIDEATFHPSKYVNEYNIRIWGCNKQHGMNEGEVLIYFVICPNRKFLGLFFLNTL
jgi:hypothetical protein